MNLLKRCHFPSQINAYCFKDVGMILIAFENIDVKVYSLKMSLNVFEERLDIFTGKLDKKILIKKKTFLHRLHF